MLYGVLKNKDREYEKFKDINKIYLNFLVLFERQRLHIDKIKNKLHDLHNEFYLQNKTEDLLNDSTFIHIVDGLKYAKEILANIQVDIINAKKYRKTILDTLSKNKWDE